MATRCLLSHVGIAILKFNYESLVLTNMYMFNKMVNRTMRGIASTCQVLDLLSKNH